ncbi:hypothetical protein H4Q26_014481 [Puccinia striiformis f. sp. tritici PST-130]|nr:hypothetical protein H4Q26_014481 [Puccinia striiformis f. sp. tritici PST-130]
MIFRLLLTLALVIGIKCTIAMELSGIDTSAEMSQSLLAASNLNKPSSDEPVSSSLVTVAYTKKADCVRDNGHQEDKLEHWIPITSESTATPGQIKSSPEKAEDGFEPPSETVQRIRTPYNQESCGIQLEPPQHNLVDKFARLSVRSKALISRYLAVETPIT